MSVKHTSSLASAGKNASWSTISIWIDQQKWNVSFNKRAVSNEKCNVNGKKGDVNDEKYNVNNEKGDVIGKKGKTPMENSLPPIKKAVSVINKVPTRRYHLPTGK